MLDGIELWVGRIAGGAGLLTLAIALAAMFRSLQRMPGREEPRARKTLRAPFYLVGTALFLGIGALLWRPIPIRLPDVGRVAALITGAAAYAGGLALYVWGLQSLGAMFGPSTGFAVRLYAGHRLVTTGPYAHIRHPMYLAVIAVSLGSLLLYRTWATLAFSGFVFGLRLRARREERILADEFADEWQAYAARVPAWLPRRIRRRGE